MKKTALVLLLVAGTAAALSASGKQDEDAQFYGRGPGMMGGSRFSEEEYAEWREQREAERAEYLETLETISITGTLTLVNGELPVVENDGTAYTIMAPWHGLGDLQLENGMTVSVEGYKMPARALQWDDSEVVLMATKAVVNGEEIVIEHPMDGEGFRGGFGGPMGGRGSRGSRGGGRGGMMGRNY